MGQQQWWRDAVVYEVYPRSFADADGDGLGDLVGVTARLPYLAELGVDAVWLTPFQRSPQVDQGYDVSDYCDVDPLFGDLAAYDALVARAHELGLRVVVDVVPNHCSDQHPLFQAALAAGPGSPERQRFHFAAGRGPDGDEPPTNWPAVFGGPSWTRVVEADGRPGEWYLHLFAPAQPDWNWRHPETHRFFEQVLRFWFDRGADGLRVDVAHALYKADGLPDLDRPQDVPPMRLRGNPLASDQEEVHDVYRAWRRLADAYAPPRLLVGEVNLDPDRAARFVRADELHQSFAFALFTLGWDAAAWLDACEQLLAHTVAHGATVTWVVENHDVVRTPTRYGGGARGAARARAAVLAVLGLPGAAYLYQGQELGLPEVDVPAAARQDPAFAKVGVSRDGCRVPLPWTVAAEGAHGFSPDGASAPWLPVPPGWGDLSVEAQRDQPRSPLVLTRTALALRRRLHAAGAWSPEDPVRWELRDGEHLLAWRGDHHVLVVSMGGSPALLPAGEVLLSSAPLDPDGRLPADAAAWVALR